MKIALSEWAGFANNIAAGGKRIKNRARIHVDKPPEQVLVHLNGRFGVAADRSLNAAVEGQNVRAQVDRRVQAEVNCRVGRIAVDDGIDRGDRDRSPLISQLEEAARRGQMAEVEMKGAGPLGLQGRTRQRKRGSSRGRELAGCVQ